MPWLRILLKDVDRSLSGITDVLGRVSAHTNPREQESQAKEIELHDDDPGAMVVLLRYLYGLPYGEDDTKQWARILKPHAEIYAVADKYQIEPLKSHVYKKMQKIIISNQYLQTRLIGSSCITAQLVNKVDFVHALQIIYTGTTTDDTQARILMIEFLIRNIELLRREDELLSLLRECPDLGADILGHPNLEREAEGFWCCGEPDCGEGCPACANCSRIFRACSLGKYRHEKLWRCQVCKAVDFPICRVCETRVCWYSGSPPRGLDATP